MSIVDPLAVYASTLPMVRMGRDHDGGYVICEGLAYDHFLSGGIADDNSFECAVLDAHSRLTCFAFDPNSDGATSRNRLEFSRAPVEYYGLHDCENALVKLDIEGAEWGWLHLLGRAARMRIAQLVIELHSPHLDKWDWEELRQLAETHWCVHAHGNNWDGIVTLSDGSRCPGTLETTWLRKDLDPGLQLSEAPIPGPLDRPNRLGVPDHVIDWPPFVWPCHGIGS